MDGLEVIKQRCSQKLVVCHRASYKGALSGINIFVNARGMTIKALS
jgi:hypothetical protein